MGVELDLSEDHAVRIGCQKSKAYSDWRKAVDEKNWPKAVRIAAWNFALDDALFVAAPQEIRDRIEGESETNKP